jgi:hypothetical protein
MATKQTDNFLRMRGKVRQGFLDGDRQRCKFFEVLVMCRSLFRLLPSD